MVWNRKNQWHTAPEGYSNVFLVIFYRKNSGRLSTTGKPTSLFTEELWIQIRNTVVFQLTKEIRIRSKQHVYWKCTFSKSICNSKNISFSFFFVRIGWNLNVLPHLPGSVLKHVGLLQGKKMIEGRLQKSIISYFLSMLFYFTGTICLCKNCCLWPSLLGSRQIFERRKTCTVPPFVHMGLAEPCTFWQAKSTLICNIICKVPCKRGV